MKGVMQSHRLFAVVLFSPPPPLPPIIKFDFAPSYSLFPLFRGQNFPESMEERRALYVVFVLPILRGSGFYKNTTVLRSGVQRVPLYPNVTRKYPNSLPPDPTFSQLILIHGHVLDKPSYWTLCFSMSLPIPADGRGGEGDEAKEDGIKKSVGLFLYVLFT